jgi:hypothetical protein
VKWDPDDPRWLSAPPDIRPVDLQVLRQVGVPEPILLLAVREEGRVEVPGYRFGAVGACRSYGDLGFLDECDDDPFACFDRPNRRW